MLIFPAIDIRDGKAVRLTQGDFNAEKVYDQDPIAVALRFRDEGAEWLHVVDLDGARCGEPQNLRIVERLCRAVNLPVQMGGGIRSMESAKAALDAGVTRLIVGTNLIANPEFVRALLVELGSRVVAGVDTRDEMVAVSGWEKVESISLWQVMLSVSHLGFERVIITDIGRDGTLSGPNFEQYRRWIEYCLVKPIASGGVSTLDDLRSLKRIGVEGVIVGKALYENRFTLQEALLI